MKRILRLPFMTALLCFVVFNHGADAGTKKYFQLTPAQVVQYAHSMKGRKVIFIYASWCPYCRKAVPQMMDLSKQRPGSVIAVSVDKESGDLIRYLKQYPEVPFHVIVMKNEGGDSLEKLLKAPPRNGIPHYIVMDEDNNVVQSSNLRPGDVAKYILAQQGGG